MILFGASGHAKVIANILIKKGIYIDRILDDNPVVKSIFEIPVEKNSLAGSENFEAIISIGNNKIRKLISEKYNLNYISAVDKDAVVSEFSKIGNGTVVMANATINADAIVGNHCIINTAAVIEHDCVIDDFAHISPNAALAGNVKVGEGTHIGIGACVIQGIRIGKWATIGAGAVIIKDVPDYATVVGNPGTIIKFSKKNK